MRNRFLLAGFMTAAIAGCASATTIPTITVIPTDGVVNGGPGAVVGWGFTLTFNDPNDWVVLTGSLAAGSLDSGTYGNYVDYLTSPSAPFYVAGPSPETSNITAPWVAATFSGLGEFDIFPTALPGAIIPGTIDVHDSVFSQDPNNPDFDPDTSTVVADAVVSASVEVDVAPEPAGWVLSLGGGLALWALRRRSSGGVRQS